MRQGALSLNGGTLNTTADISSSRAVDLLGAGTLSTDAGTTLTLNGAIFGAGRVYQGRHRQPRPDRHEQLWRRQRP